VIKDSFGYVQTKARLLKWKAQYDDFVASQPSQNDKEWRDRKSCMEYDLDRLKDELQDYEDLAKNKLELPSLESIDDIGTALVRRKISGGWTTEEIAERTGIEHAVVVDYNVRDYRTAPLEHIIKIRDLLRDNNPLNHFDYYQEAISETAEWSDDAN
jgi:hypothetical protein